MRNDILESPQQKNKMKNKNKREYLILELEAELRKTQFQTPNPQLISDGAKNFYEENLVFEIKTSFPKYSASFAPLLSYYSAVVPMIFWKFCMDDVEYLLMTASLRKPLNLRLHIFLAD